MDGVVRGVKKKVQKYLFNWTLEKFVLLAIEILCDPVDYRWCELLSPETFDDRLDFPRRDNLGVQLGDRVHRYLLKAGISAEDPDFE